MNLARSLCVSPSAAHRLAHAEEFLAALPASAEVLVVGATREAADDLVRAVSRRRGATFGLHRFSLTHLAARLAEPDLALAGVAPATDLILQALAVRSVFELRDELSYFAPVCTSPGFARLVARTLEELRLAGVSPEEVRSARVPDSGVEGFELSAADRGPATEVARVLDVLAQHLARHRLADRSMVFHTAACATREGRGGPWVRMPLLLLDVEVRWRRQAELVHALLYRAPQCLVTVPSGDASILRALSADDGLRRLDEVLPGTSSSLGRVQRHLFSDKAQAREKDGTVRVFSAPGEDREAIEIARFILDEARAGTPFEDVAVFARTPETYTPYLQTAFRRAGIPAYFAHGTRRPDPAGRAFLALLNCACEGLSARRFAEYLSFAQVPDTGAISIAAFAVGTDEMLGAAAQVASTDSDAAGTGGAEQCGGELDLDSRAGPVCAGSLRAPRRWEALLVEAAVIGGADRWRRRLDGLETQFRIGLSELQGKEADSPLRARLERDLVDLAHLKSFAMPIVEDLGSLPSAAPWENWLARLSSLALRALRRPGRVLGALADLQPLAGVAPVSLAQVCETLAERLTFLEDDPPVHRHGRVFVGPAELARGRAFSVVFVPGLAERLFPQRPREDPLLLDEARRRISEWIETQDQRAGRERLLLRLAVGAARDRLYLSYPRIDALEGRVRVISFYGLDVARAVHGEIPSLERFERDADELTGARLAWPAPPEPHRAIDAVEHDLAVLRNLLHLKDPSAGKGRAQYLVELHPCLGRSLRSRFARWQRRSWSSLDGLVKPGAAVREILARHRPSARLYSPSALENFAACPYRFLLSSVHRLEPRAEVAAIERLEPLTRGRLFHETQAAALRNMKEKGLLPLAVQQLEAAEAVLLEALERIAARYFDELAPAITRVWEDEISGIRADLLAWLREAARDTAWQPEHFELGFGLPPDPSRDPASTAEPVSIGNGFLLRGCVDLVERRASGKTLRITDHKTGAPADVRELVIGGGQRLQPVLYGLAVEQVLALRVEQARLFFCTSRGGFAELVVRMDDEARQRAVSALSLIDSAIARGMLPPYPADGACRRCDFRIVCGPYEEERARRKDRTPLRALEELRSQS